VHLIGLDICLHETGQDRRIMTDWLSLFSLKYFFYFIIFRILSIFINTKIHNFLKKIGSKNEMHNNEM
jgi:hypothetical protein